MPFTLSNEDRPILSIFILDNIIALGAALYYRLGDFIFVSERQGKPVPSVIYFSFRFLVLLRANLFWLRTVISYPYALSFDTTWPLLFGTGFDFDFEILAQV